MKLRVSAFHNKTRWSRYWLQQMGQNPMNVPTAQQKENTSNFLSLLYIVVSSTPAYLHSITLERFYFQKTCSNINSETPNDFCCCLIQTWTQTNTWKACRVKWISIKHKKNINSMQNSAVVVGFTEAEKSENLIEVKSLFWTETKQCKSGQHGVSVIILRKKEKSKLLFG